MPLVFRYVIILCFPVMLFAQNSPYYNDLGLILGVSNYLGDIGGLQKTAQPFLYDMKLAKTKWATGLFFRTLVAKSKDKAGRRSNVYSQGVQSLWLRTNFQYLRIEGDDKLSTNPGRMYRNLNFINDVYSLETVFDYYFYTSKKFGSSQLSWLFSPYLFSGIGVYYHNPKALYKGSYIDLQPLKTEGVAYSNVGMSIPLGIGLQFIFKPTRSKATHKLGIEFNWRYTFTDYLDDISSKWINPKNQWSATSIALSNRTPELGDAVDPGFAKNYGWQDDGKGNNANMAPRGDPNDKDSYLTLNVTYTYSKGRTTSFIPGLSRPLTKLMERMSFKTGPKNALIRSNRVTRGFFKKLWPF
jgi:hypothetical protein